MAATKWQQPNGSNQMAATKWQRDYIYGWTFDTTWPMIYSSQRKGILMGNITSRDLSDNEYGLSLENSLAIHLQNNHYPPVPLAMVAVCISAIESFNDSGGDGDGLVKLPEGVSWRGRDSTTAWAIIESFHLAEWCVSDYDY